MQHQEGPPAIDVEAKAAVDVRKIDAVQEVDSDEKTGPSDENRLLRTPHTNQDEFGMGPRSKDEDQLEETVSSNALNVSTRAGTKCTDALDDWNPMQEDFASTQNLMMLDQDCPLGFHLSIKGQGVTSISNTPCRFYPGYGESCWKGRKCPYKHVEGKSGTNFAGPLDLGKEACLTIGALDEKPRIHNDAALFVEVCHVVSPSEFYVIPVTDWRCSCEITMESHQRANMLKQKAKDLLDPTFQRDTRMLQDEIERLKSEMYPPLSQGVEDYQALKETLNRILKENMLWRQMQTTTYIPGELVAVKTELQTGGNEWLRAEVLDCNIYETTGRELPWFKIRLFDVGIVEEVRADRLCKLPLAFCRKPASAFLCSLYGVAPVRMKWHKSAIQMFESLVKDRTLLLTVKEVFSLEGCIKTVESVPYLVDLEILDAKKLVRVSEEMTEAGKAIGYSPFPFRPILNQLIPPEFRRLLVPNCPEPVDQEVQDCEHEKLKNILSHFPTEKLESKEPENNDL